MRYFGDPAIGRANPAKFPEFSGVYELAEGQTRRVFMESGGLFVERKAKREPLFPESSDIFFRQGAEGRILFRTGNDGKVDALIELPEQRRHHLEEERVLSAAQKKGVELASANLQPGFSL